MISILWQFVRERNAQHLSLLGAGALESVSLVAEIWRCRHPPGFASLLERIEANGVRTIVVETANRFARDLMVQEIGYADYASAASS